MHREGNTLRRWKRMATRGTFLLSFLAACSDSTSAPAPDPADLRGSWDGVEERVNSLFPYAVHLTIEPDQSGTYHGSGAMTYQDGGYAAPGIFPTLTVAILAGDSLSIMLSDGHDVSNPSLPPVLIIGRHTGDVITAKVSGVVPVTLSRSR